MAPINLRAVARAYLISIALWCGLSVLAGWNYQLFDKASWPATNCSRPLAASELQLLKMQLHPHFLFNTLHGISTLIDTDQNTAKLMIVKLSSLLRTALEHGSSDLIPLPGELKFVENYLELEKMRFGPRLQVNWSIDGDACPMLVPQLILQPLVENAIRHGVAASREGGWVNIAAHRKNGLFELSVRNKVGPKRPRGTGVGLRNTEAHSKYLYGDEANFFFCEDADHTATATLTLPALGVQDHHADTLALSPIKEGPCGC